MHVSGAVAGAAHITASVAGPAYVEGYHGHGGPGPYDGYAGGPGPYAGGPGPYSGGPGFYGGYAGAGMSSVKIYYNFIQLMNSSRIYFGF